MLSYTLWQTDVELFVEFEPLVVGKITDFAAHLTDLPSFKAIEKGQVTVSLLQGNKGIRQTKEAPDQPGIFRNALKPTTAGKSQLVFDVVTSRFTDKFIIDTEVYANAEEASAKWKGVPENPNAITFLKEQAWKIDFANAPVITDTIFEVIEAPGQILPAQGDEKTVVATSNGILVYQSSQIAIGSSVKNGQSLFRMVGGNLSGNNPETEFKKAKSRYEQAKSDYERKKELYEVQAIAKPAYEASMLAFQLAESEYKNLSSDYGKGGKSVRAGATGYIKQLFKSEGEYVQGGEALAVITQNRNLRIRADVNQTDFGRLNNQITANFELGDQKYAIESFNGRMLSFGKSVSAEQPKIPVYFELDNTGDLLPGSFIKVWLKVKSSGTGLKIPVSSLLEEFGNYSVIVQSSGESYEKRDIQIGVSDGSYVEVLSGLQQGERVVTKGVYQIKMASMSGQVPAHGHAH